MANSSPCRIVEIWVGLLAIDLNHAIKVIVLFHMGIVASLILGNDSSNICLLLTHLSILVRFIESLCSKVGLCSLSVKYDTEILYLDLT